MTLICVAVKAADYEITAADISVTHGDAATLSIELKNAGDVVGFQCDISLPEGITISGAMTLLRHQEGVHTLVTNEQEDGMMRVLVYSNPNTTFTGNSGVVLNVPLSVDLPIGDYSIKLQNSVVTAPGAKAYYVEDSEVALTVTPVYVQSVVLNKSTLEMPVGSSEQLCATVSPTNATDKSVTWTSSDTRVATVDANGTVIAVSVGDATITASSGGETATCSVSVLPIAVTSVMLDKTILSLTVGDSGQLTATVSPTNATDKSVTWTSSDTRVATVDANGTVIAVSVGDATITASSGGETATCSVTVSKKSQAITWKQTFVGIVEGDSIELNATASSGLNVIYRVLEGDATIQGNKLMINASGTIKVEASQSGNNEFSAAKAVVKTINVAVSSIDGIEAQTKEVRYFNLMGHPVENPKHGIYLRVEKNKMTKVYL